MARFVKDSQEAKDYMAQLRARRVGGSRFGGGRKAKRYIGKLYKEHFFQNGKIKKLRVKGPKQKLIKNHLRASQQREGFLEVKLQNALAGRKNLKQRDFEDLYFKLIKKARRKRT